MLRVAGHTLPHFSLAYSLQILPSLFKIIIHKSFLPCCTYDTLNHFKTYFVYFFILNFLLLFALFFFCFFNLFFFGEIFFPPLLSPVHRILVFSVKIYKRKIQSFFCEVQRWVVKNSLWWFLKRFFCSGLLTKVRFWFFQPENFCCKNFVT